MRSTLAVFHEVFEREFPAEPHTVIADGVAYFDVPLRDYPLRVHHPVSGKLIGITFLQGEANFLVYGAGEYSLKSLLLEGVCAGERVYMRDRPQSDDPLLEAIWLYVNEH